MGEAFIVRRGGGKKKFSNYACVQLAVQPNSSMPVSVSGLDVGDYLVIWDPGGVAYAMWEIHNGVCTYISSSDTWPYSSNIILTVNSTQAIFTGQGGPNAQWIWARFLKIT